MKFYLFARVSQKSESVEKKFIQAIDALDCSYEILDLLDTKVLSRIGEDDAVISYYNHRDSEMQFANTILPVFESRQKPPKIFPDLNTRWHFDNKVAQYFLLRDAGFVMPSTHVFFRKEEAMEWIAKAEWPKVFKLKGGASSSNVVLVDSARQARNLVDAMFSPSGVMNHRLPGNSLLGSSHLFGLRKIRERVALARGRIDRGSVNAFWQKHKDYVLFQEYLEGNEFDTRVTVIDDKAFIFRRSNRPGDFRASGSGIILYDHTDVDIRCIQLAFRISREFGFQSMAYDFLYDEVGNPTVCEISFQFLDSAIKECQVYFTEDLEMHQGSFWPQQLVIEMLLKQGRN